MNGIVVGIVLLLLGFLFAKKDRFVFNPITLFFVFFGSISFLAELRLFDINGATTNTWTIVIIGSLFFLIGSLLGKVGQKNVSKLFRSDVFSLKLHSIQYRESINYGIVYLFSVLAIAFMLPSTFEVIKLLLSGKGFAEVRLMYYSLDGENANSSSLLGVLELFIVTPVCHAIKPIAVYDFFNGKRDKKLIVLAAIVTALEVLVSGGRTVIVYLILIIIIGFYFFKQNTKIKKEQKALLFVLIALSVFGVFFVSDNRGNTGIKNMYLYYCGCIPHLEYRINYVSSNYIYTNGLASTRAIFYPFLFLLKNLGIMDYPQPYLEAYDYSMVQDYVNIGGQNAMNAYVTTFFDFYLDGRLIGVAIGMLIYGFVSGKAYSKIFSKPSARSVAIYLLIAQGIFKSIMSFPFSIIGYCISFIFIYIFTMKFSENKYAIKETIPF